MRYIIPKFNCVLLGNENIKLNKDVHYCCDNVDNQNFIIFGSKNELPFSFNFAERGSIYVETINYKNNEYNFIFPKKLNYVNFVQFKYQNKLVCLTVEDFLNITIEGERVLHIEVDNVSYSHFEIFNQYCLIYFTGKRNFVVAIKDKELKFATYYDEVNIKDGEYFYMCRLCDSLNHGKVFHLKEKVYEDYLVYLDDFDLNLKSEFVGCVFLDCVLAKNLNYANNLLTKELQQDNKEKIIKFFQSFDWFVPIEKNDFLLFKKNTLAGIYTFEIKDNLITNIIQQEL